MAVRAVAKKYVDVDFAYCYYDKQTNQIHHTKIATDLFTPIIASASRFGHIVP